MYLVFLGREYRGGDGEEGDRVAGNGVTEGPLFAVRCLTRVRQNGVQVILEREGEGKCSLHTGGDYSVHV